MSIILMGFKGEEKRTLKEMEMTAFDISQKYLVSSTFACEWAAKNNVARDTELPGHPYAFTVVDIAEFEKCLTEDRLKLISNGRLWDLANIEYFCRQKRIPRYKLTNLLRKKMIPTVDLSLTERVSKRFDITTSELEDFYTQNKKDIYEPSIRQGISAVLREKMRSRGLEFDRKVYLGFMNMYGHAKKLDDEMMSKIDEFLDMRCSGYTMKDRISNLRKIVDLGLIDLPMHIDRLRGYLWIPSRTELKTFTNGKTIVDKFNIGEILDRIEESYHDED